MAMTACSDGDSFYLDANVNYDSLGTMDGCYGESGWLNDITFYSRDGDLTHDEPLVYATDFYGTPVSTDAETSLFELRPLLVMCEFLLNFFRKWNDESFHSMQAQEYNK